MAVVIALTGLAFLALPGVLRRWGRSLPPREWARLSGAAVLLGMLMVELGSALLAAPTVLRAIGAPALASACERTLVPLLPGGAVGGWIAAAVAVTVPTLAWIGLQRAKRSHDAVRIEPDLGEHIWTGDHELVVLPTDHLLAVSVDGDPPQIVVSAGLIDLLERDQLEAVLRHEAAHLDHGHERYLLLATVVEHALAVFPPARRSAATLRIALERWADEAAASGVAACTRRSLRGALLGMTAALVTPAPIAAFSPLESLDERVDALATAPSRPPKVRRAFVYAPGAILGGLAVVAFGAFAADVQMVVAMAGRCPI